MNKKQEFTYIEKASILAEAYYSKDESEILQNWGISKEHLKTFKEEVFTDKKLASEFQFRKKILLEHWEDAANRTLRRGFAKIEDLISGVEDIKELKDITEALRMVGELVLQEKALSLIVYEELDEDSTEGSATSQAD